MAVNTVDQDAMNQHYEEVEAASAKLTAGHVLVGASIAALSWAVYEFVTRPAVPKESPGEGVESTVAVSPMQGGAAVTFTGIY
jgi:hypothetical protein